MSEQKSSPPAGPKRPERRGQWCIKHEKVTDELRDLTRLAARQGGKGINEWCCDALLAAARHQLGMDPLPDTKETLVEMLQRLVRIEEKIEAATPAHPEGEPPPQPGGLLGRVFGKKPG